MSHVKFGTRSMDPSQIVLKAVESVTTSEDFMIPSPQAEKAKDVASRIMVWSAHEKKEFSKFCSRLVKLLESCFKSKRRSFVLRQESMWELFHKLRISSSFNKEWKDFLLSSIGEDTAIPTFSQYVSTQVFHYLIKQKHDITATKDEHSPTPLTDQESNALRYVAGYVCRKVQQKLKLSTLDHKDEMVLFLSELNTNEDEADGSSWIQRIDRGGLWHVKEDVYLLLYAMEEEIRHHFTVESKGKMPSRKEVLDAIYQNEDITLQWTQLVSNIDISISTFILQQIAGLYLTVRGHAFATSCLELYKQRHSKKIQKSKSLRRELNTD